MNAANIPNMYPGTNALSIELSDRISKIVAPRIAGIAKRKENRAAASLLRPVVIPAVIVIPDRDIPGIIAKA